MILCPPIFILFPYTTLFRSVVLLHRKNFCSGTWEATIRVLGETGYRVVAPDQIEIGRAQSELQSRPHLVCRLLLEKKKKYHPSKYRPDQTIESTRARLEPKQ